MGGLFTSDLLAQSGFSFLGIAFFCGNRWFSYKNLEFCLLRFTSVTVTQLCMYVLYWMLDCI